MLTETGDGGVKLGQKGNLDKYFAGKFKYFGNVCKVSSQTWKRQRSGCSSRQAKNVSHIISSIQMQAVT